MAEHFKYEEMTDEELIDQLREGDRQVMGLHLRQV